MADPTADLERLRAIAEKMTPGKRHYTGMTVLDNAGIERTEVFLVTDSDTWLTRMIQPDCEPDAEALAAFDRETLLELIRLALLARTDGLGWRDRPPVPGKYVVHRIDAPAVLWYVERPDEHDGPREGCRYYGPIPPDPRRTT